MKALKQVRIVYKQHLLPPLVLPFNKTNSFLRSIHPTGGSTEKSAAKKEEKLRLDEINNTIVQQIVKYKKYYIEPLQSCPFYYQMLDSQVKKKLVTSVSCLGSYQEALEATTITERLKIYALFQKKYKEFISQLQKTNLFLLSRVKYLPLFVYESTDDLLTANRKDSSEISEIQKIKWKKLYEKKLKDHLVSLTQISSEESLSVEQLWSLQKRQIDPDLPKGLKALLFN